MYASRYKVLYVISSLLFIFWASQAQQSKKSLQLERQKTLEQVAQSERILQETAAKKKATLGQLSALNNQIGIRQKLIRNLNAEIAALEEAISDKAQVVEAMQNDLLTLKREYAEMIYGAYKASHAFNRLTFIFSAKTFNQLFLRLKYLEQYAEARKIQVRNIEEVREVLSQQKTDLEAKREEQANLLNNKLSENRDLRSLKNKQQDVFSRLAKKEKELKDDLDKKKKAIAKLDDMIAEAIRREIAQSNAGEAANRINLTPEGARLSASFEENKNRLPWPVERGFVSGKFGRQPHPVLKRISIENDGIDIQTEKNSDVRAVFEGVVSQIFFVPGMNTAVLIKHGDYLTLYARLKQVDPKIKKGYKVKAKETIGRVLTDSNDNTELHFRISKNFDLLDPEGWLYSR